MKSQRAFSVFVEEDLCRAWSGNCKGQRVSQSASFLRCFVITPLTSSRGTVVVATAHVQRKSKRDTHTHSCAHSALWSTHSIIDQPWGRRMCQSAAGGPRSLLYSAVFVLRCVSIVVFIGLHFWPLTSTSPISCLSVGLSCGLVVLTEAEWRPCSLRRNRSHGWLSAVGRS